MKRTNAEQTRIKAVSPALIILDSPFSFHFPNGILASFGATDMPSHENTFLRLTTIGCRFNAKEQFWIKIHLCRKKKFFLRNRFPCPDKDLDSRSWGFGRRGGGHPFFVNWTGFPLWPDGAGRLSKKPESVSSFKSSFYRWLLRVCGQHFGLSVSQAPCLYAILMAYTTA
jgi:hypothetical protein